MQISGKRKMRLAAISLLHSCAILYPPSGKFSLWQRPSRALVRALSHGFVESHPVFYPFTRRSCQSSAPLKELSNRWDKRRKITNCFGNYVVPRKLILCARCRVQKKVHSVSRKQWLTARLIEYGPLPLAR